MFEGWENADELNLGKVGEGIALEGSKQMSRTLNKVQMAASC